MAAAITTSAIQVATKGVEDIGPHVSPKADRLFGSHVLCYTPSIGIATG